jgi:hypothetical protein
MNPIAAAAAYAVKLNPVYVGEDITAMKPTMVVLYGLSAVQAGSDEGAIAVILGATTPATSVLEFPFYYAFGRQLRKLKTRYLAGETLATEAAICVAKWVGRGLAQTVLNEIKTSVYTIAAPLA